MAGNFEKGDLRRHKSRGNFRKMRFPRGKFQEKMTFGGVQRPKEEFKEEFRAESSERPSPPVQHASGAFGPGADILGSGPSRASRASRASRPVQPPETDFQVHFPALRLQVPACGSIFQLPGSNFHVPDSNIRIWGYHDG